MEEVLMLECAEKKIPVKRDEAIYLINLARASTTGSCPRILLINYPNLTTQPKPDTIC